MSDETILDDVTGTVLEAVVVDGAEVEADAPADPEPGAKAFHPDPDLLAKMGELLVTRQDLEVLREQAKASASSYREREKVLDGRLGDLAEHIDSRCWEERFDAEAGLCYRTNRLTGKTETRPYTPPAQREIPFPEPSKADEAGDEDEREDVVPPAPVKVALLLGEPGDGRSIALRHLTPEPQKIGDILDGVPETRHDEVRAALIELVKNGRVVKDGKARGTTYALAGMPF